MVGLSYNAWAAAMALAGKSGGLAAVAIGAAPVATDLLNACKLREERSPFESPDCLRAVYR